MAADAVGNRALRAAQREEPENLLLVVVEGGDGVAAVDGRLHDHDASKFLYRQARLRGKKFWLVNLRHLAMSIISPSRQTNWG